MSFWARFWDNFTLALIVAAMLVVGLPVAAVAFTVLAVVLSGTFVFTVLTLHGRWIAVAGAVVAAAYLLGGHG